MLPKGLEGCSQQGFVMCECLLFYISKSDQLDSIYHLLLAMYQNVCSLKFVVLFLLPAVSQLLLQFLYFDISVCDCRCLLSSTCLEILSAL